MSKTRRQFLKTSGLAAASTGLVAQAQAQNAATSTATATTSVNADQPLPKGSYIEASFRVEEECIEEIP